MKRAIVLVWLILLLGNQSMISEGLTSGKLTGDKNQEIDIVEDGNKIIIGQARFSLITPNLVRLEYSKDGMFEDRPTIRAINLSQPIKFRLY